MIWAALEEWSGFDKARNDLEPLLARIHRVTDGARRDTGIHPARTIVCTDW